MHKKWQNQALLNDWNSHPISSASGTVRSLPRQPGGSDLSFLTWSFSLFPTAVPCIPADSCSQAALLSVAAGCPHPQRCSARGLVAHGEGARLQQRMGWAWHRLTLSIVSLKLWYIFPVGIDCAVQRWPDFFFFFKLENVLLMAAMTSLVSLLPSFKDLCWKMDVVLIYLFFSASLWVSHKNYFYRRKTYFFLYLVCANDESVLVFLPSPFQKKKKEARIQQGRFEPEQCYWIHSYNRKCRAVVESR